MVQTKNAAALAEMQKEPHEGWRLWGLAMLHHAMGNSTEADLAVRKLIQKYPNEMAYQIADVYAYQGKIDAAFEWLERAYRQNDTGLQAIKGDPLLKNLKRDPRMFAFLKKMNLPLN
jgi:hypothetical protein